MSRGGGRRVWRVLVLGLVLGVAVGAGAVLVWRPVPVPGWVGVERVAGSVDVSVRGFDDPRSVPVTAKVAGELKVVAPSGGVVRTNSCKPGGAVKSGKAPFVLDDQRILFLHLKTPPWRDLDTGLRGADVTALQEELTRLGFDDVPSDGYFGWKTGVAVKALWAKAGGDPKQASIPLGQMVWLAKSKVTPSRCPLRIGQRLQAGDELFTVGGGLTSLTLQIPDNVVAGVRSAKSGETTTVIPDDGVVTDPEFLKVYSQTRDFKGWLADSSSSLVVSSQLSEPLQVVAVPPSAVYDLTGNTGCVVADGAPTPITVVASELGQTLVSADRLPESVMVDPTGNARPCR